jgi:NAD(P)-dependent dehydrogenase (short-subunit alcohol dehydrogenase family)
MDLQLHGKTAVVTGASRGIGLAVSRALAHEGVRVVGAARTITTELAAVTVATVAADLSTAEGTTAVVDGALAELGGIDILINNVGAGDADRFGLGGFLDVGDDQWRGLFDLNLFSAVWMTRAALPSLLERRGAILNIASINSRVPATGPVGYSEAKAALTAFGKRLSEEFAPRGVRVNTVSPGVVGTSLWRDPEGFGGKLAAAKALTTRSSWPPFPSRPPFPRAG